LEVEKIIELQGVVLNKAMDTYSWRGT